MSEDKDKDKDKDGSRGKDSGRSQGGRAISPSQTIDCRGRLVSLESPLVMGIINATADSFYAPSRSLSPEDIARKALSMVSDGAAMVDIGGCSTRPGATPVDEATEARNVCMAVEAVREALPQVPISVDTYRAGVARKAAECGADIINDISGLELDPEMLATVADLGCPYVLMHTRGGDVAAMQKAYTYKDVAAEVIAELSVKLDRLRLAGVGDVIIDPGFGFAKDIDQNYELLRNLEALQVFGLPVLAGMSRKRMAWQPLGQTPEGSLNATTCLNMLALQQGAKILRVHDVEEAAQAVAIYQKFKGQAE